MGDWNGTVPTILAGDIPTGDDWKSILDALTALTSARTDFSSSFTVTASGGGFVKGSSTYAAGYTRVGKFVTYDFRVDINTGGGFATGAGTWRFLVPVTASSAAFNRTVGSVWVNDSGTALLVGVCKFATTTTLEVYLANATGAALGAGGPGTAWATNDAVLASVVYEAA